MCIVVTDTILMAAVRLLQSEGDCGQALLVMLSAGSEGDSAHRLYMYMYTYICMHINVHVHVHIHARKAWAIAADERDPPICSSAEPKLLRGLRAVPEQNCRPCAPLLSWLQSHLECSVACKQAVDVGCRWADQPSAALLSKVAERTEGFGGSDLKPCAPLLSWLLLPQLGCLVM